MRLTIWWSALRRSLLALAIALAAPAWADPYPSQPVRLVIPYAAGGAVDIMGRMLAKEMQQLNGQTYIVENKGGAGGAIAAAEVAHATPDGYTVFIGATGPISIIPAINGAKTGYEPLKDFAPISLIATTPYVLVVNNSLPVKSVSELIAYAKSHPGAVNYASAGAGGPDHLAGELFNSLAGLSVPHVPYKGSGPALIDLMGGQVQYQFVSPLPAMPLVETGKVRLLAVTGKERSKALPSVPTVAEFLPGFEVSPWYGFFVPAQTPGPIIDKIAADLQKILAKDDFQQALLKRGLEPTTNTPAEFSAFVRKDVARWSAIVKTAKINAD
jgi:tripartite-type tricarboxylate transporter receptor subunit TctC